MQSSKLWDMNSLKILSKVFEDFCQEGKWLFSNISVGNEMLNFVKNKVW